MTLVLAGRPLFEIFTSSSNLYARHLPTFILISLLAIPIDLLIFLYPPLFFLNLAVGLALSAVVISAVAQIERDGYASVQRSIDHVFGRLGAIVSTSLLQLVLLVLSLLAFPLLALIWLIVPRAHIYGSRNWALVLIPFALTVYLAINWWFTLQAIVLAQKRNWGATDESAYTVRGNWGRAAAPVPDRIGHPVGAMAVAWWHFRYL